MKKFDVAIAGGGLIGASIALDLANAGLGVGLFDRQEPGLEASWAGAGILSPAPESAALIALVPLAKASMAIYPEFVRMVEEASGRSAGYRPKGTLQALFSRHAREELSTVIALHHGLGLRAEPLSARDARALEPALSEDLEAGVLRPEEASVDNRALTQAVLEAARRSGVQFFFCQRRGGDLARRRPVPRSASEKRKGRGAVDGHRGRLLFRKYPRSCSLCPGAASEGPNGGVARGRSKNRTSSLVRKNLPGPQE